MAQQVIASGPGNNAVMSEVVQYKCTGTIAKGAAVGFADATAIAALVVTHGEGTYIDGVGIAASDVDTGNPTLGASVFGVAKEGGALHDWIEVVVSGFVDYVVTDGSVEEGDVLVPTAAAGVVEGTPGETGSLIAFGVALIDDTSNVLTKAMIFKRF